MLFILGAYSIEFFPVLFLKLCIEYVTLKTRLKGVAGSHDCENVSGYPRVKRLIYFITDNGGAFIEAE